MHRSKTKANTCDFSEKKQKNFTQKKKEQTIAFVVISYLITFWKNKSLRRIRNILPIPVIEWKITIPSYYLSYYLKYKRNT